VFPGLFREERELEAVVVPKGMSYATWHCSGGLSFLTMRFPTTPRNRGSSRNSKGIIRWSSFSAEGVIVPRFAGSMKDFCSFIVSSK
jgi:hypothetical protein